MWGGGIGVLLALWAPTMHKMSSLSFAWHWHGVGAYVHLSSHFEVVESGGLLLKFHVLISVKNLMNLLACSDWATRCITLS